MKSMTDKVTTAASYSTAGATFIAGSMSLNEWLAVGGFVLAVLTFGINFYYQRKRDRREETAWRHRYGDLSGEKDD
ncbi:holin [Mangrovibacter sp. SLW1]